MWKIAPVLLVLALCACGSSGSSAVQTSTPTTTGGTPDTGRTVAFSTSGANAVRCEIGTEVYCVQRPHLNPTTGMPDPVAGVSMEASGSLRECQGPDCRTNIHGEAFAVGDKAGVGPWKCVVMQTGVQCTDTKTGKGFVISSSGVQRIS